MACDLSDPAILEAYEEISNDDSPTNWMILGYRETRDTISLYNKGAGGIDELRQNLSDEVLYGYVQVDGRSALITYMNDQVSGVRRARALVHGRAVASMIKHDIQISASSEGELSEVNIRSRLRQISGGSDGNSSPPTGQSPATSPPVSRRAPVEPDPAPASHEVTAVSSPPAEPSSQISSSAAASSAQDTGADERAEREAERKRQEAERQRREQLQAKMMQADRSNKSGQLSGYITVQGGGCYFWKRRFFTIKGKTMFLYRDEMDKLPLASLEIGGSVTRVEDAQDEVLIPNSFKVELKNSSEPYYFFADDKDQKEQAMRGIQKCA